MRRLGLRPIALLTALMLSALSATAVIAQE